MTVDANVTLRDGGVLVSEQSSSPAQLKDENENETHLLGGPWRASLDLWGQDVNEMKHQGLRVQQLVRHLLIWKPLVGGRDV